MEVENIDYMQLFHFHFCEVNFLCAHCQASYCLSMA